MPGEANRPIQDDEIECPRCGAIVYFDLTRCPDCGLRFYEPDDEGEPWNESPPETADPRGRSLVGLVAGWLISGSSAFLIQYLTSLFTPPQDDSMVGQILLLVSGPVGAFAGGYVAAQIARRKPLLHGLATGILSLLPAILLSSRWQPVTLRNITAPGSMLAWAVILLAGVAGGYTYQRVLQRSYLRLFQPPTEKELYRNLLLKVAGDREVVERLVEFERLKAPDAPRTELLQNAIDRWERHNR